MAPARPGIRFGLIDEALAPLNDTLGAPDPARLAQLKHDLAAVVSAEAFFSLTDLARLTPDEAIASLVRTATTITQAARPGPPDRRTAASLAVRPPMEEDQVQDTQRRRRDFIRTHHPDRGGDSDAFVAGMRSFDAEPDPEPLPRVFIVRRRAWPVQLAIAAARRLRLSRKSPRVH